MKVFVIQHQACYCSQVNKRSLLNEGEGSRITPDKILRCAQIKHIPLKLLMNLLVGGVNSNLCFVRHFRLLLFSKPS